MSRIVIANENAITEAADLIRAGDIAALPTETVYGLGANALDDDAVSKIFAAKKRPAHNPLIVHVVDKHAAQELVHFNSDAHKVVDMFWPGALTLILPRVKDAGISKLVTAGLETLAVRVPAHKVMRAVIKQSGVPIAAPSANSSGEPSATTPQHVAQSLGDNVPYILAAGICDVGLESTVLDLSGDVPTILRYGAVTLHDLQDVLGPVDVDVTPSDVPKSPGQLLKHYAPKIPVRLNAFEVNEGEALLAFGLTKFMALKSGGGVDKMSEDSFRNLSEAGDLEQAAKNLFMMLRDLDSPQHKAIAVMNIPEQGIGIAINERLSRAARG